MAAESGESSGSPSADALLEHLEASLGSFAERGIFDEEGRGFSILEFPGLQHRARPHATYGISRHVFRRGTTETAQELVIAVRDVGFALGSLDTIGRTVLERHAAVTPGERHRLPGWHESSAIEGVLALPDPDVAMFLAADPPVEFMRLLPITASEARFVTEHGWETLARRLSADDVALADLFREPAA